MAKGRGRGRGGGGSTQEYFTGSGLFLGPLLLSQMTLLSTTSGTGKLLAVGGTEHLGEAELSESGDSPVTSNSLHEFPGGWVR